MEDQNEDYDYSDVDEELALTPVERANATLKHRSKTLGLTGSIMSTVIVSLIFVSVTVEMGKYGGSGGGVDPMIARIFTGVVFSLLFSIIGIVGASLIGVSRIGSAVTMMVSAALNIVSFYASTYAIWNSSIYNIILVPLNIVPIILTLVGGAVGLIRKK